MFGGEYSIDDKGRLTLPAQMRRPLADGGNLVVLDGRIIVWTEAAYRAAVDLLNEQVAAGEVLQMHVRTFLSNTHPVGPDAQGRIVIPPAARVEGGLERDVLVLGAGPRIEIVPAGGDDLLGLLGIDADPIRSREHILLANLLDRAWREGRDMDVGALIRQIQKPPIDRVGVMDLESFFPAKERFELAMSLNNLLASPGFAVWAEGEPLEAQNLLFTPDGRPRLSIISIAHLSDAAHHMSLALRAIADAQAEPDEGFTSIDLDP